MPVGEGKSSLTSPTKSSASGVFPTPPTAARPSRAKLHSANSVNSTASRLDLGNLNNKYPPRPIHSSSSARGTTATTSHHQQHQQPNSARSARSMAKAGRKSQSGSGSSRSTGCQWTKSGGVSEPFHVIPCSAREMLASRETNRSDQSTRLNFGGFDVLDDNELGIEDGNLETFPPAPAESLGDGISDGTTPPLPRLLPSRGSQVPGSSQSARRPPLPPTTTTRGSQQQPSQFVTPQRGKSNISSNTNNSRNRSPPHPGASSPSGMSDRLLSLLAGADNQNEVGRDGDRTIETDIVAEEIEQKYSQHNISEWTSAVNEGMVHSLGTNRYKTFVADQMPGVTGESTEDKQEREELEKSRLTTLASRQAKEKQKKKEKIEAMIQTEASKIRGITAGSTTGPGITSQTADGDSTNPKNKSGGIGGANVSGGGSSGAGGGKHLMMNSRRRIVTPSVIGYDPTVSPSRRKEEMENRYTSSIVTTRSPVPLDVKEQAQVDSQIKFFKAISSNSATSLSSKLLQGVPGRGIHKEIRDEVLKLKQEQLNDIYARGPEAVFGKEPSFLEQLFSQGQGEGVVVAHKGRKSYRDDPPTPKEPIMHPDPKTVRQRKLENDAREMESRQMRYTRKIDAATSSGANAAYCAKTFLTWIKLIQCTRCFAGTFARDWDPFDDEKREGTLFHPPHSEYTREMMKKAGLKIKVAMFRYYLRSRVHKKRESVALLVQWLRVIHNDMKMKFAVHHYLSRIRRIQRGWRAWAASETVRAAVWSKQYLQEEKKLIQLLTLEREISAANQVEGTMGSKSLNATVKDSRGGESSTNATTPEPSGGGTFLTDVENTSPAGSQMFAGAGSLGASVLGGGVGGYGLYGVGLGGVAPGGKKITGRARDELIVKHLLYEHRSVDDLLPKLRAFNGTFNPTDSEHVLAEMQVMLHELKGQRKDQYSEYLRWLKLKANKEVERAKWEEENKEEIERMKTGKESLDRAMIEAAMVDAPLPPPPSRPHLPRYLRRRVLVDMFMRLHADRFIPVEKGEGDEDEANKKALAAATKAEAEAALKQSKRRGTSKMGKSLKRKASVRPGASIGPGSPGVGFGEIKMEQSIVSNASPLGGKRQSLMRRQSALIKSHASGSSPSGKSPGQKLSVAGGGGDNNNIDSSLRVLSLSGSMSTINPRILSPVGDDTASNPWASHNPSQTGSPTILKVGRSASKAFPK